MKSLKITNVAPLIENIESYSLALSNLAIAEATLVKAGKQSALPHFIAIVKELERLHGFTFEALDPENQE